VPRVADATSWDLVDLYYLDDETVLDDAKTEDLHDDGEAPRCEDMRGVVALELSRRRTPHCTAVAAPVRPTTGVWPDHFPSILSVSVRVQVPTQGAWLRQRLRGAGSGQRRPVQGA
jgi:hypothetical protein